MKRLTLALALALTGGVASHAAQDDSRYERRDPRPERRTPPAGSCRRCAPAESGAIPDEMRRRQILRERLNDLGDRVRLAEREGRLSHRQADRLFDRLDAVRDFLAVDRTLTVREFERRVKDLSALERDLREALAYYRRMGYPRW